MSTRLLASASPASFKLMAKKAFSLRQVILGLAEGSEESFLLSSAHIFSKASLPTRRSISSSVIFLVLTSLTPVSKVLIKALTDSRDSSL